MLKRVLVLFLGTILLFFGVVGLFIPILPGILFLIGAAACFSSVSPPINRWMQRSPRVRRWQSRWQSSAELPWYRRVQLAFWLSAESVVQPFKRLG